VSGTVRRGWRSVSRKRSITAACTERRYAPRLMMSVRPRTEKTLPRRSNDFQELIRFLETQLAPEGATVTESVMLEPLDGGDPVEVDVLLKAPIGHHDLRVAIECRDHSRPASVEWINELAGRYAALPVDRVVAVSRKGFTRGARHRANGTKVHIFTLKEARETDWPATFQGWRLAFIEVEPRPHALRITYHGEGPILRGADLFNARIEDCSGRVSSTVGADAKELYQKHARRRIGEWLPAQAHEILHAEPEQSWMVDLAFKAIDRVLVTPDGTRYAIDALIIEVACTVRVRRAPARFYEYQGARVTEFSSSETNEVRTSFSLLLDADAGIPKSLNVRQMAKRPRRRGRKYGCT
jgi:hypothetical protein